MLDSVAEFRISTPGMSPKKIINSKVANGFNVKEQKEIFKNSPEKKDSGATNGVPRYREVSTNILFCPANILIKYYRIFDH